VLLKLFKYLGESLEQVSVVLLTNLPGSYLNLPFPEQA